MSENSELTLRKSLDEVDRIRKWQIAGIAVVFVYFFLHVLGYVVTLRHAQAPLPQGFKIILITSLESMVFTVIFCTLGVCIYINRMTKRLLMAIELSSRP